MCVCVVREVRGHLYVCVCDGRSEFVCPYAALNHCYTVINRGIPTRMISLAQSCIYKHVQF